jgi:hypothetical protein
MDDGMAQADFFERHFWSTKATRTRVADDIPAVNGHD